MNDDEKKIRPAKSPVDAYRKTDVMTANRETILLMMYGGAIRFIKRAKEATAANDVAERTRLIGKVQEIITELRSTLDFEVGGDIAKTLESLYAFIYHRLTQATLERKDEYLDEVSSILTTLNGAWEQAVATLRKERSKQPIAEK